MQTQFSKYDYFFMDSTHSFINEVQVFTAAQCVMNSDLQCSALTDSPQTTDSCLESQM